MLLQRGREIKGCGEKKKMGRRENERKAKTVMNVKGTERKRKINVHRARLRKKKIDVQGECTSDKKMWKCMSLNAKSSLYRLINQLIN